SSPDGSMSAVPSQYGPAFCASSDCGLLLLASRTDSNAAAPPSTAAVHLGASFATAASNLAFADFDTPVSHVSSSTGVPLKAAMACLMWHLSTPPTSFPKALAMPLEHAR